jgi:hypothetical protein
MLRDFLEISISGRNLLLYNKILDYCYFDLKLCYFNMLQKLTTHNIKGQVYV